MWWKKTLCDAKTNKGEKIRRKKREISLISFNQSRPTVWLIIKQKKMYTFGVASRDNRFPHGGE